MIAPSSIGSRFQVLDLLCGLVEVSRTRKEALAIAKRHANKPKVNSYFKGMSNRCSRIEVF